jgi:hypothetical protein
MVDCPADGREPMLGCFLVDRLPYRAASNHQQTLLDIDGDSSHMSTEVDDEVLRGGRTRGRMSAALDRDLKAVGDSKGDLRHMHLLVTYITESNDEAHRFGHVLGSSGQYYILGTSLSILSPAVQRVFVRLPVSRCQNLVFRKYRRDVCGHGGLSKRGVCV